MKELSIIILTWNSEMYFQNCIMSVLESTCDYDKEIIIIDNGSTDKTISMIESYLPSNDIVFFSNEKNEGVAKARNLGINKSKGKYIWILDVDTVVNKEAISTLIHYIKEHPDCGICGCKLMNSLGNIQDSCRKYPSFKYKCYNVLSSLYGKCSLTRKLKTQVDEKNESQFYRRQISSSEPFEVDYVIGACQIVRKEVFYMVGLLDEHIFYGPEDADFCLRANRKGWKVIYLPQVSFIHEYQQMTNKRLFSRMSWIHIKALFYFFKKHNRFGNK